MHMIAGYLSYLGAIKWQILAFCSILREVLWFMPRHVNLETDNMFRFLMTLVARLSFNLESKVDRQYSRCCCD